jgi:large subunit ribosomal protein L25
MDEKVRAEIDIVIEGVSSAVKEQGGILINNLDKIEIECLPGDLIHDIKVSIDGLVNLRDSIHVSDLKFPETITVLTPPEEVVVMVEEPRSEEELSSLNEEIKEDVESVEGVVKKEAEEGEEGEAEQGESAPAAPEAAPEAKKE